jgi:hypothetical protein
MDAHRRRPVPLATTVARWLMCCQAAFGVFVVVWLVVGPRSAGHAHTYAKVAAALYGLAVSAVLAVSAFALPRRAWGWAVAMIGEGVVLVDGLLRLAVHPVGGALGIALAVTVAALLAMADESVTTEPAHAPHRQPQRPDSRERAA